MMLRFRFVCICYCSVGGLYSNSYHSVISIVLFKRWSYHKWLGWAAMVAPRHPTDSPWQEKRLLYRKPNYLISSSHLALWPLPAFSDWPSFWWKAPELQKLQCLIAGRKDNFILNYQRKDHAESTEVEKRSALTPEDPIVVFSSWSFKIIFTIKLFGYRNCLMRSQTLDFDSKC